MPINLEENCAQSREDRLGSITAYSGSLKELTIQGCEGCLKRRNRCISTATYCSHLTAVDELSVIKNAVVVDHGPVGCSSGMMRWNVNFRAASILKGLASSDLNVISTNIKESDTVFGAAGKLKDTVRTAYKRHHPDVIFITSTCTSSIIGEDIEGVIDELKDEIPIPIGYTSCEGIRSKIWASGFDAEQHTVLTTLVKPPKKKQEDLLTVVDFLPALKDNVDYFVGKLGLRTFFLNSYASVEEIAHASEATASIGICSTLATYFNGALELKYGVTYLKTHYPNGMEGFDNWLRDIARHVGKEEAAERCILEEREKYLPAIEKFRILLKGKKAMILLGPGFAYELIRVCRELDMEVVDTISFHYDPILDGINNEPVKNIDDEGEDLPIEVSDAQHYETVKLIEKYKPDIVITRVHGAPIFALKLGIPVLTVTGVDHFGYSGVVNMGELIVDQLSNTNFARGLKEHTKYHFTDWYNRLQESSLIEKEEN